MKDIKEILTKELLGSIFAKIVVKYKKIRDIEVRYFNKYNTPEEVFNADFTIPKNLLLEHLEHRRDIAIVVNIEAGINKISYQYGEDVKIDDVDFIKIVPYRRYSDGIISSDGLDMVVPEFEVYKHKNMFFTNAGVEIENTLDLCEIYLNDIITGFDGDNDIRMFYDAFKDFFPDLLDVMNEFALKRHTLDILKPIAKEYRVYKYDIMIKKTI